VAAAYLQVRRGSRIAGAVMAGIGVLLGIVYFVVDEVPNDFSGMTPYVITLLVLAFASQRLRMPAADGQIYRKGSAG
jgi:simple sugar transport system permease protein